VRNKLRVRQCSFLRNRWPFLDSPADAEPITVLPGYLSLSLKLWQHPMFLSLRFWRSNQSTTGAAGI